MADGGALSTRGRYAYPLAMILVVAWSIWPWRILLHAFPWRLDAARWIQRGALDDPNWWQWVFTQKHFIGYRPVAALSYTLNPLVFGWNAWGWRVVDFGLHAGVVAAVGLLLRQLTGRVWASVVAALLFAAHPAVEEVITYAARRSYSLSAFFGLFSLLLLGKCWAATGQRAVGGALLAGAGLGLALLSNEIAYVLVVVAGLLGAHAWWQGQVSAPGVAARLAPTAVVTALALVARQLVLGKLGGYQIHYFAYIKAGKKAWVKLDEPEVGRVALASLDYLVQPVASMGSAPFLPLGATLGWVAVIALLGLALWPTRERRLAWLAALLVTWIGGYALLYGLTGTWFWRQGYAMAMPYALLVALAASQAGDASLPRWRRALVGTLAALVIVPMLTVSPLFRGVDARVLTSVLSGSQVVHAVAPLVRDAPGPGTVALVAPLDRNGVRDVPAWVARVAQRPDLRVTLVGLNPTRQAGRGAAVVEADAVPPMLVLAPTTEWYPTFAARLSLDTDRVSLWRLVSAPDHQFVSVVHPVGDEAGDRFARVDLPTRVGPPIGDTAWALPEGQVQQRPRRKARARKKGLDAEAPGDDAGDDLFEDPSALGADELLGEEPP